MDAPELTSHLDDLLPGFRQWTESDANPFNPDRVSGVFSSAMEFTRTRSISLDEWTRLAEFLNAAVGGTDEALDTAASTCFLKKLAVPDHPLGALLEGEARKFWDYWV